MASSAENVKLGVCRIYFGGVDLGYTKGGVEVEVSTETHKKTVDQFGETEIDEYIMKRTCVVSAPLAETTLENLVTIMPGATLVTDSIHPTKKRVDVKTGVGTSLLTLAKTLILRPIEKDGLTAETTDKSEDFIIPQAGTAGALNFAYKVNEERVFSTTFTAYPDANGVLFKVGDESAA
jgi:hypothetical protein